MNPVLAHNKNSTEAPLEAVAINNEWYYKINHVDALRPFFMSIVSDSNHWLFVASNGGLSAGRKNADLSLFPYYTDDKITASAESTGSKTIIRVQLGGETFLWEPFSIRNAGQYEISRNLYKSKLGNKIIFEEQNKTLGLTFSYQWASSNLYGFVRTAKLVNNTQDVMPISIIDGVQNVLPYGVGADLQTLTSNLADAYKRTELEPQSGLGIFALSAMIVDKAEPSEALKANIAWALGIQDAARLLSTAQFNTFRQGAKVQQETDVKGESGAYLIAADSSLAAHQEKEWLLVLNVNQTAAQVASMAQDIVQDAGLYQKVLDDVALGNRQLIQLAAAADGLQFTADGLKDSRHFANVLFNIMRGGIFDNAYQIEKWDFEKYLSKANKKLAHEVAGTVNAWNENFSVQELKLAAAALGNADFERLATEYLPLKFSRRHGDPSRPWNKFSINTRSEIDGSKILDYQGNWRDIFQNWEALAHSFPAFLEGMIYKFLNASTFEGYNPYRVTKDGFDWETIEPDNPWSYIGYWGDHQLIYLLKFLERYEACQPQGFDALTKKEGFVYAHVPYIIKDYAAITADPKNTIDFDTEADHQLHRRVQELGADGALLTNAAGSIHRVSFMEKILATLLAKLSNFVPDGGIWMNTQRPEWNDANNALVGNGLSMVTLCYLRRFLKFLQGYLVKNVQGSFTVSAELHRFFIAVYKAFENNAGLLNGTITAAQRKQMVDALGMAGSDYRTQIYQQPFSGNKEAIAAKDLQSFIHTVIAFTEQSITNNKRADGLYHSYNIINYDAAGISVSYLSEMLEGQVAVLSSGYLSAAEAVQVLDALQASALYREDQHSYILYPNKNLPGFLSKNNIPKNAVQSSALLQQLVADGNTTIIEQNTNGGFHFNGNFKNAGDLTVALENLDAKYDALKAADSTVVLQIFEDLFKHKEFTGRSGTFYGYEGLGSIYWHMVSKLLLAVYETYEAAQHSGAAPEILQALHHHFHEINEGIGVHKTPQVYGAFPTDPYSHTPFGKGAQQPGMTGQVKEDIISRFGELGVSVQDGCLVFQPALLKRAEFLDAPKKVNLVDAQGAEQELALEANSLLFTICQVPIIYQLDQQQSMSIEYADGTIATTEGFTLSEKDTAAIFNRTGAVVRVRVTIHTDSLVE